MFGDPVRLARVKADFCRVRAARAASRQLLSPAFAPSRCDSALAFTAATVFSRLRKTITCPILFPPYRMLAAVPSTWVLSILQDRGLYLDCEAPRLPHCSLPNPCGSESHPPSTSALISLYYG